MRAGRWVRLLTVGTVMLAAFAAPASGETDTASQRTARGADPQGSGEIDRSAATRAAAWDRAHRPPLTLRQGTPAQAGLAADHLAALEAHLEAGLTPAPDRPAYPGAVVLAARNGVIAEHAAYGDALRYRDDGPTELPADERLAMEPDTIFDLASVSKLFTTVAVMQLAEADELDLDAPVADTIPAFGAAGKETITTRQLLTHTAGLPAWLPLYSAHDTREERLAAVYDVEPVAEPGEGYLYSDLGLIVLGELVAALTGHGLDEVVAQRITEPLGMDDTGYDPGAEVTERTAATEYQPYAGRGMVHGEVHDENAWSLDGVAGHAGVFSTAEDLAVLAQTLLNGGRYGTARILDADTVHAMMQLQTPDIPGVDRALGFELHRHWYMDAMTTPMTAGHTGFTGTSLVIDPTTDAFAILLTNRVHPDRSGPSVTPTRNGVARTVGRAVPVAPATGDEAWFSGLGDDLDQRLEVDLDLPAGDTQLSMALWYDTEAPDDVATVELSTDDGRTWQPLTGELSAPRAGSHATDGTLSGWGERRWWNATFDLGGHEGPATLRVRHQTDALYGGRGVYVDAVRVDGPHGPVFDGQRPSDRDRWRADGWHRSGD